MDYRRRRQKRRYGQQRGSGAGKLVVVLLVSAAVVYFISASAAGTWIAQNVAAPLFTGIEELLFERDDGGGTDNDRQVALINGGESKKEEITLPGVRCYMLQMGVYSNLENALAQAETLQKRGAGGYIIADGERYRVIASGYDTEESLNSVREQLNAEGMENAAYEVSAPDMAFMVTADEAQLASVKAGFSGLKEAQSALSELAVRFDKEGMSLDEGRRAAEAILSPLAERQQELSSQQEEGNILSAVLECYRECVSAVDELSKNEIESIVDFSSKIKYTHLQVTDEYVKLVTSLSSTS